MCRPAAGPCDFSEVCDGFTLICPSDRFLDGVQCGPAPSYRDRFTAQPQATCRGTGATCPPPSSLVDCRPYTCGNGQCLSVCGNDDMCWDNYCEGGVCKPKLPAGRICSRDRQCASSNCRGGHCCSSSSCFNQHGTAACAAGSGACIVTCSPGWGNCDGNTANGCETNLDPDGPWTLIDRGDGTCTLVCDPGWGNCDGDTSNGCETNLDPDGPWTWVDQGDGTCSLACDPGWGNCDGDVSTGCETDLNTNENCGACGNSCPTIRCGTSRNPGSYECVNGTCQCVIPEIEP